MVRAAHLPRAGANAGGDQTLPNVTVVLSAFG